MPRRPTAMGGQPRKGGRQQLPASERASLLGAVTEANPLAVELAKVKAKLKESEAKLANNSNGDGAELQSLREQVQMLERENSELRSTSPTAGDGRGRAGTARDAKVTSQGRPGTARDGGGLAVESISGRFFV